MGSIYCYLLVKVGYPASFTQFPIEQTGSAFTLKHLALPQKRADEEQTYKHTNSNRSLDIPGEASTGAEPKRQRGTKWSHRQTTQGSSALYCSSREGHQATCQSWLSLVGWPGDRGWGQETNQPARKSHQYRQKAIHRAIAPSTVRYKLMLVL